MANFIFLDTETNGVHIINSKPFSVQVSVGLKDPPKYLDISLKVINDLTKLLRKPNTWLIGHNIKFDCHMLINAGVPIETFKDVRIVDTMFMARLAIDHTEQAGTKYRAPVSLRLKTLAEKYLGADSKDEELVVKEKFRELNTQHKLKFKVFLTKLLNSVVNTKTLNDLYGMTEADYLVSNYNDATKDQVLLWFKNNPKPTYQDIPDYVMEPYGLKDILLTKGLFSIFLESIKFKQQQDIFVRESKTMYPLLLMEREGLTVDKDEAKKLYKKLYDYRAQHSVVRAPNNLLRVGAQPVATYFDQTTSPSVNTNTVIYDKERDLYLEYSKKDVIAVEGDLLNLKSSVQMAALYRYETNDDTITSANKQTREEIMDYSPTARMLHLLAPLNKIIDTYLKRLINETVLDADGNWKLYGTYNNMNDSYNKEDDSAGTITGRLSSDLQQFPKEALLDEHGNELVNIRKLFIVPKNKHSMFYFDMGQLELKLQTIWSAIIDGSPDKVMARGFGPFDCTEKFDSQGNSLGWFLNEDLNTQWQPTDFHTLTAEKAFGNLPDYQQNKAHYRSLGKRANFAISYGASKWKLIESLKVSEQVAEDLIKGFKDAYVGLTHMEKYLRNVTKVTHYQTNLLGRRYYTREVHKLKNWLVQGSGGDLLKIFLIRLVPFVEQHPHWKFMLTVHDEIDFVLDKEPTPEEVKAVCDLMFYTAGGIDITADPEYTLTSWGELKPYHF